MNDTPAPQPSPEQPAATSLLDSTTTSEPVVEADAAPAPVAEVLPLTREDLTVPEGLVVDEEHLTSFLEALNGDLAPKDRATALLGLHEKLLTGVGEQLNTAWEATQEEWRQAARALPEIGGDNLDRTLGQIAKVIDRYGDKDTREAFALTGAGNHPAVIKLMAAIAKDVNETAPISGQPVNSAPKSRAERMYGSKEGTQ